MKIINTRNIKTACTLYIMGMAMLAYFHPLIALGILAIDLIGTSLYIIYIFNKSLKQRK